MNIVNLEHILIGLKLEENYEKLPMQEIGNKKVRDVIIGTLSKELFDVYCQYQIKNIWDIMNKKYVMEDAGIRKYAMENFTKFWMTKDRNVPSQIHDYHQLIMTYLMRI